MEQRSELNVQSLYELNISDKDEKQDNDLEDIDTNIDVKASQNIHTGSVGQMKISFDTTIVG